ncbi:hypothetical protein [Pseudomonas syringae]|uniref:hypothetical protein n=1 Tax=Pseudomonas syringae TaxID=317 RepID=UPI002FDB6303
MTSNHQSPFKAGEVLEIQQRLLASARRRHADSIADGRRDRALWDDGWFANGAPDDVVKADSVFADLDKLVTESLQRAPETDPHKVFEMRLDRNSKSEVGPFAGEASYRLSSAKSDRDDNEDLGLESLFQLQKKSGDRSQTQPE